MNVFTCGKCSFMDEQYVFKTHLFLMQFIFSIYPLLGSLSAGNFCVLKGLLHSRCLTLNPWPKVSWLYLQNWTFCDLSSEAAVYGHNCFVFLLGLFFLGRFFFCFADDTIAKLWHYTAFHMWVIRMVFSVDPLHNKQNKCFVWTTCFRS